MNTFDTLKAHLDAAREQITESDLFLKLMREADVAFRANEAMPREYLRLDSLAAQIFETAALLADDDITELTATIANEKGGKMNAEDLAKAMYLDNLAGVYQLPDEPAGPLWDKNGGEWTRDSFGVWRSESREDWGGVWPALLNECGPLTSTPPIKVGDTGLTAEQVWGLPEGTVIWPERAVNPEPWMRYGDRFGAHSGITYDAGELQCTCGDGFTVLRLGGGE